MIVCSILSILIPSMAELGSWGAMLCRALQGLCQGFFYPSIHAFLSKWIPLSERSRFGTFVYAGKLILIYIFVKNCKVVL